MMTREALEAALEFWDDPVDRLGLEPAERLIFAAARRHLALMPEKCGTCGGDGSPIVGYPCKDCHGSGKVYPQETVEKIGTVTTDPRWSHIESPLLLEFAVAVLDALGGKE